MTGGIPAMLLAVFDDKVQSVAVVGGMEDANVKAIAQHWHCEDIKYAQDVMRMAWCRPPKSRAGSGRCESDGYADVERHHAFLCLAAVSARP